MSDDIGGVPYFEIEFTKKGKVFKDDQEQAMVGHVGSAGVTDLVVVSHGWRNDMTDARNLYKELLVNVAALDSPGRTLAFVGVLWPSKKFGGDAPGGGASTGDQLDQAIAEGLDQLADGIEDEHLQAIEDLKEIASRIDDGPQVAEEFVEKLRSILPAPDSDEADEGDQGFFDESTSEIVSRFSAPGLLTPTAGAGGAAGFGDGLASVWNSVKGSVSSAAAGTKAAIGRSLNYATYYQMKRRAGLVGKQGLNGVLANARTAEGDLRIHLVGHSFGGKLVTAALDGPSNFGAASMSLLQAAFSHNAFAKDFDEHRDGAYRSVVKQKKVSGPMIITHSKNDQAVGYAYPIASRLAGQDAAGVGGPNSPYGALGANGAVKSGASNRNMHAAGTAYKFEEKKIYNLESTAYIKDHGDVRNKDVAFAVHSALVST